MKQYRGNISQFQSMGTLDGPGLRYVVFMQGCTLHCAYCHNPETWSLQGDSYSVEEVMEKILRCKSYIIKNGGVTVSGGEALLQWEFVKELFTRLRKEGIHTALDTSGIGELNGEEELLEVTELVICDLKFNKKEDYKKYTKSDMGRVLEFLNLTQEKNVPLWIRHVVVPGITDKTEYIRDIVKIAKNFKNLEKIELLPFRKLCIPKYESMGIEFLLANIKECSPEKIKHLNEELRIVNN